MNIKRAIELYKDNMYNSLYNMKEFTAIGCGWHKENQFNCGCIRKIQWDNLSIDNNFIILKNGYKFKLSVDLGNLLENDGDNSQHSWVSLFQPYKTNQTMEQRNMIRHQLGYKEMKNEYKK